MAIRELLHTYVHGMASIQRLHNVGDDVVWTLKRRCVRTGLVPRLDNLSDTDSGLMTTRREILGQNNNPSEKSERRDELEIISNFKYRN